MHIHSLHLYQYKSHQDIHLDVSSAINCFTGANGSGKTNILEALHYLSLGKSFLGQHDEAQVQHGTSQFMIEAKVEDEEKQRKDRLQIQYNLETRKKSILRNAKPISRLADHIGYLPSVVISPYDGNLISDTSDTRRRFLDQMISQTDANYLHSLILYQKTLQQRNSLLRDFQRGRYFDPEMIEMYTPSLVEHSGYIHQKRKQYINEILPEVQRYYTHLSAGNENVSLDYQSDWKEGDIAYVEGIARDRQLGYTSHGVHRDDLIFQMNGFLVKKSGSQGQQKSFLIALKLAQINRIEKLTERKPIVLLDDIFDKLDDQRVSRLVDLVSVSSFGQIFITDTHTDRTTELVQSINPNSKIFRF